MDFTHASFKEFEKLRLKATSNMKIGNREIEAGETIVVLDTVQIFGLTQSSTMVTAKGGYNNSTHIVWETPQDIKLTFSNGVFSKEEFALFTKSNMYELSSNQIVYTFNENLESDENSIITLSYAPLNNLFIYKKETGEKLTYTQIDSTHYSIAQSYCDVYVEYNKLYNNSSTQYILGSEGITEYLELEGRTRIKDDTTGEVVTGILRIPRFKLMSNVSLRLGNNAQSPMVTNFNGLGVPVGSRGNMHTWEFYILEDDIDSDD